MIENIGRDFRPIFFYMIKLTNVNKTVWSSLEGSVWYSVRWSVWSVWYSVWDSVRELAVKPVANSVEQSVCDSVRNISRKKIYYD